MSAGRNAPCPCGSGKKYKHCCLRAASAVAEAPQELLRRRLRALIAQMERDAQTKSPPLDAEITQMLRRELGLPAAS